MIAKIEQIECRSRLGLQRSHSTQVSSRLSNGGRSRLLTRPKSRQCDSAMLKRNVLANLAGSVWIAALTLLITPIQIHLLGIEAYGLIGFIATLQVVVSVLDFGLSSTITREIAADHSPGHKASGDLLRTAVLIYWGIAAIIGVVMALLAGAVAHRWFKPDTIDIVTLQRALQIAAIYLALRWPVALTPACLPVCSAWTSSMPSRPAR